MAWSDTFQDSFTTVVNAGADLLKSKAEEEAKKNNAAVNPKDSDLAKYQPLIFGAVGVLVVAVLWMLLKRR